MNAVFERDFVVFSASARFQWLRFACASAMGAMLLALVLPGYARGGDFSGIGSRLFEFSVLIGMGFVVVATPGAFATVLVHSRAGGTLPVLLTTPLSTLSIAAGAFGARAAAFAALVVATWPPIAASLLFGGVRGSQLFAATSTIAATGLIVAAPAFLASAFARRTSTAVVSAYLAASASVAALYVVAEHVGLSPSARGALSPIHAALAAVATGAPASQAPYVLLAWSAAAAVAVVVVVSWRLSREGRGDAGASRVVGSRRKCRPMSGENPVLDRERRAAGVLRGGAGRSLLLVLLASEGVFWALAATTYGPRHLPLHFAVLAMQVTLIIIAVTAAGATSLAAEREGRTLDLVRVSPLAPRDIVVGKLVGLVNAFWPCLLVPLGHLVVGACLGVFSPFAVVVTAVSGAVATSTWAVFALSQSLDQANPNAAVLRTMGAFAIVAVLLAANVGIPINAEFTHLETWVGRAAAFSANPVALALLPAAVLRTGGSDATNTFVKPPDGGDVAAGAILCVVWLALHAGATLFIYRRLFHTYKTRVGG